MKCIFSWLQIDRSSFTLYPLYDDTYNNTSNVTTTRTADNKVNMAYATMFSHGMNKIFPEYGGINHFSFSSGTLYNYNIDYFFDLSYPPKPVCISSTYNDIHTIFPNPSPNSNNLMYCQWDVAPSVPQNLNLSNVNNHPHLTWDKNIDADISYYEISRNVGHAGWIILTDHPSGVSFDDLSIIITSHPQTSCSCDYMIKAVDKGTNKSSDYSNYVRCLTPGSEQKSKGQNPFDIITDYSLMQNYPNPFNPTTSISYQLPQSGLVQLKVYNMLGKEIAVLVNEIKEKGKYSIDFNAANLSSGMYIYSLRVNDIVQNHKMTLIK